MNNTSSHKTTRRRFVGGLLQAALAASVAPSFIPRRLLAGDNTPGKKIQLGHIGTGGQGSGNLRNFLAATGCASVAICDPFRARREKAGKMVKDAQGFDPVLYNDFRELLANPSIDAVVIATPDHWHVPIGLAAVKAGKDVYIEKPLSHCLDHNKLMADATKKYNKIFQYGTQQRSNEILARGVNLVRNGYIGELQRVEVWAPPGKGGGSLVETPVPEGLDYDLYIGPAPMRPCTADRITSTASWYCNDYSIGFIAGWGAHPLDIAVWGMDSDTKGPYTINATGTYATPDALFNNCTSWDATIDFSDKVSMHFMSADIAAPVVQKYIPAADFSHSHTNGTTFIGTKGWISLGRNFFDASNKDWFKIKSFDAGKQVLYHNRYYQSFVDSVRDRSPSIAPIEDALRSDAISHLSLMALKNKATVMWDPNAYKILSPTALNSQMSWPVRGNWLQA
jgi:predicted dehydrogenase